MPRAFLFALVVMLSLASCAMPPDPLAAQRKVYEERLKKIEPGMTRRQLYALLPPCRTPTADPPVLRQIVSLPMFTLLTEEHPLDENFTLHVEYRLAHLKEYPDPLKQFTAEHPTIDDALSKEPVDHSCPSKQVMADVLSQRPVLCQRGKSCSTTQTLAFYHELTATHRFNKKGQIGPTP